MCNNFVEKYNNLSDDELIHLARTDDNDAFNLIFERYKHIVVQICTKHIQDGFDFDDLMQEATISFYYAVIFYDFKSSAFSTFISVCIERGLTSAIRKFVAKKRVPYGMLIPLEDNIDSIDSDPEMLVLNKESHLAVSKEIKDRLSNFEFKVLLTFLKSGSYDLAASELGVSRKSVDNALARLRKKLDSIN